MKAEEEQYRESEEVPDDMPESVDTSDDELRENESLIGTLGF